MKDKWKHIFDQGVCPELSDLQAYQNGRLSHKKMYLLERHVLDCEICQDILSGLQLLPNSGSLKNAESDISKRIALLLEQDEKRFWNVNLIWKMALTALFALLIGIGYLFYNGLPKREHSIAINTFSKTVKNKNNDTIQTIKSPLLGKQLHANKLYANQINNAAPAHKTINVERIKDSVVLNESSIICVQEPSIQCERDTLPNSGKGLTINSQNEVINNNAGAITPVLSATSQVRNMVSTELIQQKNPSHSGMITISGFIKDAATNEPLMGADVVIKGTSKGVVTDEHGYFKMQVNDSTAKIEISFVGYKTVERPVGREDIIDIAMNAEQANMQEVVVIGYGSQKKSNSITSATGKSSKGSNAKNSLFVQKDSLNWSKQQFYYFHQANNFIDMKWQVKAINALDSLKQITIDKKELKKLDAIIQYVEKANYRKAKSLLGKLNQ